MKRNIHLVIEARDIEIRAAKDCASRNGETSMKAMLKNFVETKMRNYAFDDRQRFKRPNAYRGGSCATWRAP